MKNEKPGGGPGHSKFQKGTTQPIPSSAVGQAPRIKASNWQPFVKNTLQGFVDLRLPSGLLIRGCLLHKKNDNRWVSFPGKPYKDEAGNQQWQCILEIPDKARLESFKRQALAAIDRLIEGGRP